MGLLGLALHLETGHDRAEVEAWATSPEAVEFMTASNERWFDASVAAGTPVADARAAADRTIAAYTGVEGE